MREDGFTRLNPWFVIRRNAPTRDLRCSQAIPETPGHSFIPHRAYGQDRRETPFYTSEGVLGFDKRRRYPRIHQEFSWYLPAGPGVICLNWPAERAMGWTFKGQCRKGR